MVFPSKSGEVLEEKLAKLVTLLDSDRKILAAYLFGSYVRGLQTSQSDIDIAVLLSEIPDSLLEYYLHLTNKLTEVLENEVDLIILNVSPPLLRYQVIKYSRLLYSRNEKKRTLFEAKSLCEYLDFSRVTRRYYECFMKKILA